MKKTLLTIALMLALGLTACGGDGPSSSEVIDSSDTTTSETTSETSSEDSSTSSSSSEELTANSFEISNKDELTAEWKVGDANRTLEFTSDPLMNTQLELNQGNLVVTSNNPEVVSVTGIALTPVAVGTVTVTATWRNLSDSVTLNILEQDPPMTLRDVREYITENPDVTEDDNVVVDFYGRITATMEATTGDDGHVYSGVFVQDGDYAIMLYAGSLSELYESLDLQIGDDIYARGVLSPYNGLNEVKPSEIRLIEEDEYTVSEPTTLTVTGDNWNLDTLTGQDSRLVVAEDVEYVSGKITSVTSHATIKVRLPKADGTYTNADLYVNYHLGQTQMAELQTIFAGMSEGTKFDFKGVLGWHENPQLQLEFLEGLEPSECITIADQPDPTALSATADTTNLSVGQKANITVSVQPAGAKAGVSYESSDTSVVTVDDAGVVSAVGAGTATVTVTSTAVTTLSDTVDFVVTENFGPVETKDWVVGGSYKLGTYQANIDKTLMLNGDMDGYYGDTTEVYTEAATFVIDEVDGGYTLKTGDQYLAVVVSGNYKNFGYQTEPFTFTYNEEYNTFIGNVGTVEEPDEYFFSLRGTFETFSCGGTQYLPENFALHPYDYRVETERLETAPADGSEYIIGVEQGNLGETFFSTGLMSGHYGASTTNPYDAVTWTVGNTAEGYTFTNGDKYIGVTVSGEYTNISFDFAEPFYFEYDETYNTFKVSLTVEGETGYYYIGTYNNFNTFSVSSISYIATSFPMHLYTVEEAPAAIGIKVNASAESMYVGDTVELSTDVFPTYGQVDGDVSYASSNTGVATVEGNVVTGVSAGTTVITATAGAFTSSVTLTVEDAPAGLATKTVVFVEKGYSDAQDVTDVVVDEKITLTFSQNGGSNAPKYFDSGEAVRMYANNSLTITPTSDVVITNIVINTVTGSNGASGNTESLSVTNGTLAFGETTVTITVTGAGEVVLTRGSSGQLRITSISVTYRNA